MLSFFLRLSYITYYIDDFIRLLPSLLALIIVKCVRTAEERREEKSDLLLVSIFHNKACQ